MKLSEQVKACDTPYELWDLVTDPPGLDVCIAYLEAQLAKYKRTLADCVFERDTLKAQLAEKNEYIIQLESAVNNLQQNTIIAMSERDALRDALSGLYQHTKNNHVIAGLNTAAREALTATSVVKTPEINEGKEKTMAEETNYSYYDYMYKGLRIDPYRILKIYNITDPAQQHAIKKLLRAGKSNKSYLQDINEAIDTLKRLIEIYKEDN